MSTGLHTAFFPILNSVGRQVQLRFIIDALAGDEEKLQMTGRDVVIRGTHRIKIGDEFLAIIDLTKGRTLVDPNDLGEDTRTGAQMLTDLQLLQQPGQDPLAFIAPGQITGYCEVLNVTPREIAVHSVEPTDQVAIVAIRRTKYKK